MNGKYSADWLAVLATKKGGAAGAAGCVEGLWKKGLRIDGPFRAQGFVSLTALRAEGCGGGFAAIFKVSVTGLPSRPHRHSEP